MSSVMLLGEPFTLNLPLLASLLTVFFIYILLLPSTTPLAKPILFFTSLCFLYLLIGSPLVQMTRLSFSVHMIQMGILYFIIPPLLLLGIPHSMIQKMSRRLNPVKRLRIPFSPTHALYLFSLLLLMYHVPIVYTNLLENRLSQTFYEVVLFSLSISMWWPIASPVPSHRKTGQPLKRYVFKSGLLITPACLFFISTAFIDASHSPFLTQFTAHLCVPDVYTMSSSFHTKFDQFFAGISMFGLHKIGLMMTVSLKKEEQSNHSLF